MLALLVQAAAASASGCDESLLFAFFTSEQLFYALSEDGLHWTTLNGGEPVMSAVAPASIRDPYLHATPGGGYRLVSTDGQGFGNTPNILTWSSVDLITFSPMQEVPVMGPAFFPPPAVVTDTWAPEWVYDTTKSAFLVFWAARGSRVLPILPSCSNTDDGRFAFWATYTAEWAQFSPPFVLFDPGCNQTAPVGDGGIDGDLVQDDEGRWVLVYKDARGLNETVRGVRAAVSSTSSPAGPYADISELLVPTLVEAPEAVRFAGSWLLFYDCSFMPTPQGWPRPPYGVARSTSGTLSLSPAGWAPVPGACTGNSPDTAFPKGATHGSFICTTNATAAALAAAFPG
jgi:hypothetical protein